MKEEDRILEGLRGIYNKLTLLNKSEMEVRLKGYTASEVHCIDYIGSHGDANVTKLADSCYMTNGAISKLTQKLMGRGVLESYQQPDNRKEVYFRLTEEGRRVYMIHNELHGKYQERDGRVFRETAPDQLHSVLDFIDRYNAHLDGELQKRPDSD